MNKRGVATLIFIFAIILSIFSFTTTKYVENHSNVKGQTIQQTLQGKIQLAVLPQESGASVSAGGSENE